MKAANILGKMVGEKNIPPFGQKQICGELEFIAGLLPDTFQQGKIVPEPVKQGIVKALVAAATGDDVDIYEPALLTLVRLVENKTVLPLTDSLTDAEKHNLAVSYRALGSKGKMEKGNKEFESQIGVESIVSSLRPTGY